MVCLSRRVAKVQTVRDVIIKERAWGRTLERLIAAEAGAIMLDCRGLAARRRLTSRPVGSGPASVRLVSAQSPTYEAMIAPASAAIRRSSVRPHARSLIITSRTV